MSDEFGLQGRTVLVTGGTRGIGRAISLRLARAGARVVANYARNDEAAATLQAAAASEGLALEVLRADLTLPKGLSAVLERMAQPDAGIVSLVHCAATGVHRPIEELTTRHLDWTMTLNARAFFELLKGLLPSLTGRFDGRCPVVGRRRPCSAGLCSGRHVEGRAGVAGAARRSGTRPARHPRQHPGAGQRRDRSLGCASGQGGAAGRGAAAHAAGAAGRRSTRWPTPRMLSGGSRVRRHRRAYAGGRRRPADHGVAQPPGVDAPCGLLDAAAPGSRSTYASRV